MSSVLTTLVTNNINTENKVKSDTDGDTTLKGKSPDSAEVVVDQTWNPVGSMLAFMNQNQLAILYLIEVVNCQSSMDVEHPLHYNIFLTLLVLS